MEGTSYTTTIYSRAGPAPKMPPKERHNCWGNRRGEAWLPVPPSRSNFAGWKEFFDEVYLRQLERGSRVLSADDAGTGSSHQPVRDVRAYSTSKGIATFFCP